LSEKVEGVVEAIKQRPKNFGVLVDGSWYGGLGRANFNKGDKISFSVTENKGYWNMTKDGATVLEFSENVKEKEDRGEKPSVERRTPEGRKVPTSSQEYWQEKFEYDKERDLRIIKQSCLNRAIEFFTMNIDRIDAGQFVSEESVIKTSEKFEKYVKGGL